MDDVEAMFPRLVYASRCVYRFFCSRSVSPVEDVANSRIGRMLVSLNVAGILDSSSYTREPDYFDPEFIARKYGPPSTSESVRSAFEH